MELSYQGGCFRSALKQCCVREIVIKDLPEVPPFARHGLCTPLAKTDPVPLPNSLKEYFAALLAGGKTVAGHGVPTEPSVHGEPPRFAFVDQEGRVRPG